MADFHRYVTPAYYSPETYDLINVVSGGVGGGDGSAPADVAKSGGPNDGTYFVAFGEDATSLNTNRMAKALAENTDLLDDYISRDLATPYLTDVLSSGAGGVTDIPITGEVYVGPSGATDDARTRAGLVGVLTSTGEGLVAESPSYSFSAVLVSKVHDGAGYSVIGTTASGFYTDPTIRVTLPASTSYRLLYYVRSKVKNQDASVFTRLAQGLRGSAELTAEMRNATSFYPTGTAWHDTEANGPNTLKDQVDKIVRDLIDNAGSDRIGSSEVAGTALTLTAGGSILDQLGEIVTFFDALLESRDNTWGGAQQVNNEFGALTVDAGLTAVMNWFEQHPVDSVTSNITSIGWGNALWVAGADDHSILYSCDGKRWLLSNTSNTTPFTGDISGAAYVGSSYAIAEWSIMAPAARIRYTANPRTSADWSITDLDIEPFAIAAYGSMLYVVVGIDDGGTPSCAIESMTDIDGTGLTKQFGLADATFRDVVYGEPGGVGIFVAVGMVTTPVTGKAVIYTAPALDPTTWTKRLEVGTTTIDTTSGFFGVCWNGQAFCAVGGDPAETKPIVYFSPDGENWTASSDTFEDIVNVFYDVACRTSADGTTVIVGAGIEEDTNGDIYHYSEIWANYGDLSEDWVRCPVPVRDFDELALPYVNYLYCVGVDNLGNWVTSYPTVDQISGKPTTLSSLCTCKLT